MSRLLIVHLTTVREPEEGAGIHHTDELILLLEIIAGNMGAHYIRIKVFMSLQSHSLTMRYL